MINSINKFDKKMLTLECLKNKYMWPTIFHDTETRFNTPLIFKTKDRKLNVVQIGTRALKTMNEQEIDAKLAEIASEVNEGQQLYVTRMNINLRKLLSANAITKEEASEIKNVFKDFVKNVKRTNTDNDDEELTLSK